MRRLAVCLMLAWLQGCATSPPLSSVPAEHQVLVVLEDQEAGRPLPSGSKRGYRGDRHWPVSLHTRADADRLARDHELREIYAWPIPRLGLFCVVYRIGDGTDRQHVIESLDADPRVAKAQRVQVFEAMLTEAYDDPLFDLQYGEHRQALESVHALTTGEGVRVGIVDSPVDDSHVDLHGQIVAQYPPEQRGGLDAQRHGTAVAGVIAASAGNGEGLVGLAPGATVSVYAGCRDTTGSVTRCTTVSLAEAIESAIEDRSDVINLSIAGPQDWLLERLLRHAHDRGTVLVAADNPQDPRQSFPGSLSFVHAAGPHAAAWFARQEQFSTRAGGGYQVFFGSSISAAGVTGVAALLRTLLSSAEAGAVLENLLRSGCFAAHHNDSPLRMLVSHENCPP